MKLVNNSESSAHNASPSYEVLEQGSEKRDLLHNALPAVVFGLMVAVIFGVIFIGWASIAPIDSAAIANGSVVLDANRKTIQHLEGGIITEIMVEDGDEVIAGQPLIKLNPVYAKAVNKTVTSNLLLARATEARLIAERDELDEIEFDGMFVNAGSDKEVTKIINSQKSLFKSRRDLMNGRTNLLEKRIAQLNDHIEGIEAQQEASKTQLEIIKEEIETVAELLKKGHTKKSRLLALQRAEAKLKGEMGNFKAETTKTREKITENEIQMLNLKVDNHREILSELKEVQAEVNNLQEKLSASTDVYERTVITAPQSGKVTGLKFHTIGGVIPAGAPIMDIVPQDDILVIEARVSPQDIDIVHEGLDAKVMLSAYRSRFVPRLDGKVTRVSADKFTDERQGTTYYLARVEINRESFRKLDDNVKLYPGMPAETFIVTGSRTFLDYLISPITDSFRRSFREQ